MVEVLIPNTKKEIDKPLIFLAGPIKGTYDWHSLAIEILNSYNLPLIIASPSNRLSFTSNEIKLIPSKEDFTKQREWENHYLQLASQKGAIMFWLPRETEHHCDKVYGAMTRIELGEWMTEYKYNNSIRLSIGTDGNFPEIKTIVYDLKQRAPKIEIQPTLEKTCQTAIDFIQTNK